MSHEQEAAGQSCLNITFLSRTRHVKMAFDQNMVANKYFTLIYTNHYTPTDRDPHNQAGNEEGKDDLAPMTISSQSLGRTKDAFSQKSGCSSIAELHPLHYFLSRTRTSRTARLVAHRWSTTACGIVQFAPTTL